MELAQEVDCTDLGPAKTCSCFGAQNAGDLLRKDKLSMGCAVRLTGVFAEATTLFG